ncbi:MAG: DUF58 domain-containing protein [Actinobacteria bacterium]|nr:MAG: DUF58 domain-containing protein [Actinomycetota bacterium]
MNRTLATAALGTSLCLLAGAFGLGALYVPGIALALLAGAAAACVRLGAWRVQLARDPDRATVEEGAPLRLTLHVSGRTLPLGAGEVSSYPGAPPKLLRHAAGPDVFVVRPQRRGRHRIEPSSVRFRDPFGMCERTVCSPATEVLVLPRAETIRGEQLARLAGAARDWPAIAGGAHGSDVDGLRAYRPGAPASLIHWPTVARTGELFERRLRAEGERLPLVVLDSYRPPSEQALDAAVRAAASLCLGLARLGGCSLLMGGSGRVDRLGPELGAWPALHERLALVRPAAGAASVPVGEAPVVIYVTARAISRSRELETLQADYIVSPLASEHLPVLFALAGCAVQPVQRASRPAAA